MSVNIYILFIILKYEQFQTFLSFKDLPRLSKKLILNQKMITSHINTTNIYISWRLIILNIQWTCQLQTINLLFALKSNKFTPSNKFCASKTNNISLLYRSDNDELLFTTDSDVKILKVLLFNSFVLKNMVGCLPN